MVYTTMFYENHTNSENLDCLGLIKLHSIDRNLLLC
jgi:hypothetical protein